MIYKAYVADIMYSNILLNACASMLYSIWHISCAISN